MHADIAPPPSPGDLWDSVFDEVEQRPDFRRQDWSDREAVFRIHDRLYVLFGHLEPLAVDETFLLEGLTGAGMTGEAIIRHWAAWKALGTAAPDPLHHKSQET